MKVKPLYIILAITIGILIFMNAEKKEAVSGVIRDLPSSATPSANFDVVITLSSSGQSAVIVRDNIPTGCTHVSGGTLEGSQIKTVLGSLTSNTLTYTINCNAGNKSFSGTYDGGSQGSGSIGGDSSLNVVSCTDSSWSPETSTVCSGTSFTQTSNCGNTRSATGTKPSTSRTWTQWSSCSVSCGTGTQTRTCQGTVACGGTDQCTGSSSQSCTISGNTPADTDCNNDVSDTELISYINKWMSAQVTDAQLIAAINTWL